MDENNVEHIENSAIKKRVICKIQKPSKGHNFLGMGLNVAINVLLLAIPNGNIFHFTKVFYNGV
jgi:hypothetical protein